MEREKRARSERRKRARANQTNEQRCVWQRAVLVTHLFYCVLTPLPVMDRDKRNIYSADYQRHAKQQREENETVDEM